MFKLSITGLVLLFSLSLGFLSMDNVGASTSLQIRPLLVNEKLKVAEVKKGYIDVSNPADQKITVRASVKAFRQTDNQGNLEFFDSKELEAGMKTDLSEFELGPREALRMYYLVDGRKLPPGDVFGAIFFTASIDGEGTGINQSARVGSLIVIENGTPGSRRLDIDVRGISPLQIGYDIRGRFTLTNPADADTTSGFFPEVTLGLTPLKYESKVDGPLLMAGRTRQIDLKIPTNRIGVYKLTVNAGDTTGYRWMIVVTGWWRWVCLGLIVVIIILVVVWRLRQRPRGFKKINRRR